MEKFKALLDSNLFKTGITVLTFGVGATIFFHDLYRWLSKNRIAKTDELYRMMLCGSLMDNGVGMILNLFGKSTKTAWNDHLISSSLQGVLLGTHKYTGVYIKWIAYFVSLLFQFKGWFTNLKSLFSKSDCNAK